VTAPAVLRVLVLAALAAALLLPAAPEREPAAGAAWLERGEEPLVRRLLDPGAPPVLVRSRPEPPTEGELALLGALARRAPLLVARPDAPPALRVEPPADLRAGRRGALAVALRGAPGDSVRAVLLEGGVAVDSLRLAVGPGGEARGSFRLRPTRAGWQEWEVEVAGAAQAVGAWVEDAAPPRVLLVSGAPGWESRFAGRALEEAGAEVAVSQSLGPGVRLGVERPGTLAALRAYDAVVLLPGAPLDAAWLRLLERYVAEAGGGVLVAGAEAALPALALAGGSGAGAARGEAIAWSLPAELAPLPAAPVESAAEGLEGVRPGALAVATDPDAGPLLALRALGRGRAAALGVRETWRWRLEAGRVEEHRDFWRALVDWVAGGASDPRAVRLAATLGPVGLPVEVRVYGAGPETAPALRLTRPDGSAERLAALPDPEEPGAWRAAFLPAAPGVHALSLGGEEEPRAAFRAAGAADPGRERGAGHAGDRWARLALLAERSGGGALPPDSVGGRVERLLAERGGGGGPSLDPRAALLALVVLAALLEWTLRRTRGLA
jgi:hypothetical protein